MNSHKEWILCVTDKVLIIFDEYGTIWAERLMYQKAGELQDVVFGDFNNDGITDIVTMTSTLFHFHSLTKSLYSVSWYALPIMLALALLAVVYPNIKYAKQELRRYQQNPNSRFNRH